MRERVASAKAGVVEADQTSQSSSMLAPKPMMVAAPVEVATPDTPVGA
jgi:hypothetical protein